MIVKRIGWGWYLYFKRSVWFVGWRSGSAA